MDGKDIREFRESKHMSRAEFAKAIGVTKDYIDHVEIKSSVNDVLLGKIRRAFQLQDDFFDEDKAYVTPDYLYDSIMKGHPKNENQRIIRQCLAAILEGNDRAFSRDEYDAYERIIVALFVAMQNECAHIKVRLQDGPEKNSPDNPQAEAGMLLNRYIHNAKVEIGRQFKHVDELKLQKKQGTDS